MQLEERPIERPIRATSAQYGIWVAQQVDPDDPGYLTAETIELDGALDVDALTGSVEAVLDHADALHMRFAWADDTLWQYRRAPATRLPLVDLSRQADPDQAARDWMKAALAVCCDVTSDPLYRTALLRLSPTRHWWYLQVHHIVLDGFGYGLLQQAVAARYNARVGHAPVPTLPDWRVDRVVEAEASYRANGSFEADRTFWSRYLRDLPAPLVLAPKQDVAPDASRATRVVDGARLARLRDAAGQAGVDWNAWLLCATGIWLARQGGQRDLTLGLPVMNRLGTPALGVPCMAMNIVPFRVHVDAGHSPRDLARACSDQLRAIRPHLYYRYGWIRGDLGLLERNVFLFNQAVNVMPFERQVAFRGLASETRAVSGGPVKDLNVTLAVRGGAWHLTLEANPNAYDADTLAAHAQSFMDWLDTFAACAADEPVARLLDDMPPPSIVRGAPLPGPHDDVIALIERAARGAPAHTAIEAGERRVDYRTLLADTAALADALARRGVTQQTRVAFAAPRAPDVIAAMLAVLKLGAVIVPLDPDGPPQRTAAMLADASPAIVVTRGAYRACAGACPVFDLDAARVPATRHAPVGDEPVPDSLAAYLLYTSGSTGRPNGVLTGRGALGQFVASTRDLYAIGPGDRVLQFAPLHFDASFEEVFATLCHGATLVLRDDAMLDSVDTFTAEVERRGITVLDLPTAYWHVLAHALDARHARRLERVRLTIIGGEAALPERIRRWHTHLPVQVLLNTYGPTEATIIATAACVGGPQAVWQEGEPVPIGTPRAGVDACIVDERAYPVAAGRTGELVLCGDGLALAYAGNPALTAERFVTLPRGGQRAYRTGDLATLRDGRLYFDGRIDHEVKISGVRIDPREIEDALLREPDVREAAVVASRSGAGAVTLAAFVAGPAEPAALRMQLAQRLPAAAIPDRWHVLERLPRNANGKIDRNALQRADVRRDEVADDPRAGALERQVMAVWRNVLGEVALTPATNFFDIGGKSLQAMQASARLAAELGRDVPVSMLFRHPTIAMLTAALRTPLAYRPRTERNAFAPHLAIQSGSGAAPRLICIHPADGLAWSYLRLAAYLPDATIDGLQLSVDDTRDAADFDALVHTYVRRVRALQPDGPYHLLGWSLGGALAYGVAAALARDGDAVGTLALMDSYPSSAWTAQPMPACGDALRILLTVNGDFDTADLSDTVLRQRLLRANSPFAALGGAGLDAFVAATLRQMRLFRAASTPRYDGELLLFNATRKRQGIPTPESWHAHRPSGTLTCHALDCSHDGMSDPEPMAAIGAALTERLAATAGPDLQSRNSNR
ncbi:non-ribosomal peptide synthetase [Burkholderia aenigmatica]|uniref:non-ribosomal peptide synthetase n=1 Tax=Burkholderia cepacia complex TaxID=87882 RepID=UPI000F08233C|nr:MULTISPECIES: non-ribosomal peptide synthetase [Burkholderia cepacia complex]AYQ38614.1 non-ribosomal peptide synthetase [Burkholderia lata]VWC48389.1 non-ribosomal peptide synthetase [Burkholderia aenigmatica]